MNVMGRGLSFSPVKIKVITITAQPSINRTRVTNFGYTKQVFVLLRKENTCLFTNKEKARRINGERIIIFFCSNEQSCYIDIEYHFKKIEFKEIDTIRNPFNWIRK